MKPLILLAKVPIQEVNTSEVMRRSYRFERSNSGQKTGRSGRKNHRPASRKAVSEDLVA